MLVGTVTLFAVALPWPVRLAICVAVAIPGFRSVRSFVLLEGPHAVRSVEWSHEGEFVIWVGRERTPLVATIGAGSFRFGLQLWVLRFETSRGPHPVLIADSVQDARAFRRLSRCLKARLRRASGRGSPPTVNIRPKV